MKPEAQQIAIAEACGIVSRDCWGPLYKTAQGVVRVCPDYLNDLNAMHEAEKVLCDSPKRKHTYLQWLGCEDDYTSTVFLCVAATAAQRAEAFLRTIGKWEEAEQ